jgi:uncharacterized damage-inducible protein DinB
MSVVIEALIGQFEASLKTLKNVIASCPDEYWHEKDNDYPFSQVAFHTLFYIDYYLTDTVEAMKQQPFHVDHQSAFRDYEELGEEMPTSVYEREFILEYLAFCHDMILALRTNGTEERLEKTLKINGQPMSTLEMLIYVIRHIQHHTAQMGLRLQFQYGNEMEWVGRGWE